MTFRDLVEVALGNLRRMKLRTFLTTSGVVIAIGAFVAMLSFGAGMQRTINNEFDQLGLLHTMHVYPSDNASDTTEPRALDSAALSILSEIPGVNLAYPLAPFSVTVTIADTQITTQAQSLSREAIRTKLFSRIEAGKIFTSDQASEAIVTTRLLDDLNWTEADSLIGKTIVVSVDVVSFDSALASLVFHGNMDSLKQKLKDIDIDSLRSGAYRGRLLNREFEASLGRFLDGYLNARATVSDTLTIVGIIKHSRNRSRTKSIITTIASGKRLGSAGFSGGPQEMMTAMISGQLFGASESGSATTYKRVTLDLSSSKPYEPIRDSVQALGFRTFSYAEEFEEIRRIFIYFNLALGLVGLIALLTSALGIVNTMLMSIVERRREIGIIKSLGADEREIRLMFLMESGMIGLIGSIGGILVGWIISRVGSLIAQSFMVREGMPPVDLFAVPPWLIGSALLIGLLVSVAAGYYPSARAAAVDAVAALRND